jgi:hypothetical protein
MNLDDFMQGSGLDTNAETLPQVYGFDDDQIVDKVKRLYDAALGCNKDHEILEMVRGEADSDLESILLIHLLNKAFMATMSGKMDEAMSTLAMTLGMSIIRLGMDGTLSEEQLEAVQNAIVESIDKAINDDE